MDTFLILIFKNNFIFHFIKSRYIACVVENIFLKFKKVKIFHILNFEKFFEQQNGKYFI